MNSHMHTAVESSYRASETSRALMAATLGLVLGLAACDRLLGADRRIERAQESFEAGRYDAAMSDVKTALEAEPENAQGRLLLARISLRLGDAAAARQELDRALAAGADPAQARELHYEILLREGRYQDALIAAAVDDDLAPARRLGVMAHSQLALGQYDEAAEAVQELKALDAGDSAILLLEARLHWANGRHAEAEQSLDQLLAQDPADAEAWMQKARVASAAGRIPDARAAYTEALKTANQQLALPEIAAIHVGLVENYLALSDLDGADAAFRPMQARFAEAFVTQYLGARIALARGDFSAAVTGLQRALAGQPDNVPARLLLGAALIGQGSSEQAEAELSQIIARQPDNVEARKLLARVYLARNDTAAARRVLADLPEGDAADPATDWFTGAVMMMAGQATEGIARLEQAAAADDKNTALKLDLARAYIGAGRRADALRTLSRIPEAEGGAAKRQLMLLAEVAGLEPAAARQGVERLMRENSRDADLLTAAGSYLMQTWR